MTPTPAVQGIWGKTAPAIHFHVDAHFVQNLTDLYKPVGRILCINHEMLMMLGQ